MKTEQEIREEIELMNKELNELYKLVVDFETKKYYNQSIMKREYRIQTLKWVLGDEE